MAFSFLFAGLGGNPGYDILMMCLPGIAACAGAWMGTRVAAGKVER
jgi:hypothetical protein